MASVTIYLSRSHARTTVYAIPYSTNDSSPSHIPHHDRGNWREIGFLEGSYNPLGSSLVACEAWHLKDLIESKNAGDHFVVKNDKLLEALFMPSDFYIS